MPSPDAAFQPGFRISTLDKIVLIVGGIAAIVAWQYFPWLGYAIACVVGHFFLFCNVVRMSRGLELAWSAAFLLLTGGAVVLGSPSWSIATLGTFAATGFCVAVEMRKPSYHGALWQTINPSLPLWWDEQSRSR